MLFQSAYLHAAESSRRVPDAAENQRSEEILASLDISLFGGELGKRFGPLGVYVVVCGFDRLCLHMECDLTQPGLCNIATDHQRDGYT